MVEEVLIKMIKMTPLEFPPGGEGRDGGFPI